MFENSVQRAYFVHCLRNRCIPTKFMFAGSAAHLQLRYAIDYPTEYIDGRSDHEIQTLSCLLGDDGLPDEVCDIGTSNGVHTAQFINKYNKIGTGCRRYLGIDFSQRLIDGAKKRLEGVLPTDHSFLRWDIETSPPPAIPAWRTTERMLLCLFGNTLGNVDHQLQCLKNLFQIARPGDILAVGVYMMPDSDEELLEHYSSSAVLNVALEPLRAAGIADSSFEICVRCINSAVVIYARMRETVSVLGVVIRKGEMIKCFISRRYRNAEIISLLLASGWSPIGPTVGPERGYQVLISERQ
jgi:L-histidine Nalpha-methyltransferase